jgi:hypothetical protein
VAIHRRLARSLLVVEAGQTERRVTLMPHPDLVAMSAGSGAYSQPACYPKAGRAGSSMRAPPPMDLLVAGEGLPLLVDSSCQRTTRSGRGTGYASRQLS